ncbi:MAG: class I mannose-6-phosphate isomerase [Ignavibacteriales bacterium]|nr:class I mannose-6-phosphate isomerase [Ignavibacteriales bacterium]
MNEIDLYPLKFEPIYQYRIWGGRRLGEVLSSPLSIDGPIGEAWILSDRDDHMSCIANGPLRGETLGQLFEKFQKQLLGNLAGHFSRFPLLLKFLDAKEMLSVQVHPDDSHIDLLPAGETGKTEAWVVLEASKDSRIYAGLKPGTTVDNFRKAITDGNVADKLTYFTPKSGDGVFIPAGTVHTLGGDVVVFEIQENSDVTFRLYDWDHVDTKTGKQRELQVEQAISCIDFSQGAVGPVVPKVEEVKPALRERLFLCEHFGLWRLTSESKLKVGEVGMPRVLVCIYGNGQLKHGSENYSVDKGDVLLLPAVVGVCDFLPLNEVCLLEITLPV